MPPPTRHFHLELFSRSSARVRAQGRRSGLFHAGIKVDDVQPGYSFEFLEEAEDVSNGEFAFSTMNQLDCLPACRSMQGISTASVPRRYVWIEILSAFE